jgi:hypothetical protein
MKFISKNSELVCERYLILEWILLLEIPKNLQKLGLEGEMS